MVKVLNLSLAAAALGLANAENLRDSVQQSLRASATKKKNSANDPMCYEILDDWWDTRVTLNDIVTTTDFDFMCDLYTGPDQLNTDACNSRNSDSRAQFITENPSVTDEYTESEMLDVPCSMIGTGNGAAAGRKCVSNNCNQLNTGDCTLAKTGGNCVWWTQDDIDAINDYRGYNSLSGHGCYRNPCNMPGEGQASEDCPNQSNGVLECGWCYGSGDDYLKGLGMGCQAMNHLDYPPASTNNFAPTNSGVENKDFVFVLLNDNGSQSSNKMCDASFRLCNYFVSNAGVAASAGSSNNAGEFVCRNGAVGASSNGQNTCQTS